MRRQTVLAVDVGGCLVPCLIVLYKVMRSLAGGGIGLGAMAAVTATNVAVC